MSGEINSCADLCAFIRANQDSPELIERALSNPEFLAKIHDWDDLHVVINALGEAGASELIPRVLTAEVLAKLNELAFVIWALNEASRSVLIPRLLTAEILAKIQDGRHLSFVIWALNEASRSDLIPLVLTDQILAKINNSDDLALVITSLKKTPHLIPLVLTDQILAKKSLGPIIQGLSETSRSDLIRSVLTAQAVARIPNGRELGNVIYELRTTPHLIPMVLTAEIFAKIEDGSELSYILCSLNQASRFDLIPLFLRAELLAKIQYMDSLVSVLHGLRKTPHLIPTVLTAEILAKIPNGGALDRVILFLNDASHIAMLLASEVIREKFPEACDPLFSNRFDQPTRKKLVDEALSINAGWSLLRRAWVGVVAQNAALRAARAARAVRAARAPRAATVMMPKADIQPNKKARSDAPVSSGASA
jgi:hypothetical protein